MCANHFHFYFCFVVNSGYLKPKSVLNAHLASHQAPRLVMCDEVVWEFLTLSMASWNAIWSAVLAVVWIWALVTALGRSAGSRA